MDLLKDLLDLLKIIIRAGYDGLKSANFQIMTEIFKEIWPIMKDIMWKFNNVQDIVESSTQLIKIFMRGMRDNFKFYLNDY